MLVVFGRHEWANSNTPASTGPTGTLKSHGYLTSDYQLPFWMVMPYGISPFSDTLIYHISLLLILPYCISIICAGMPANLLPCSTVESSSFFAKNTWRETPHFSGARGHGLVRGGRLKLDHLYGTGARYRFLNRYSDRTIYR